MVEVRSSIYSEWRVRELIADLSGFNVESPYICRDSVHSLDIVTWKQMREIEPEPERPYMTSHQWLDAIRGGAVWRCKGESVAYSFWRSNIIINDIEICYDWRGDDSDLWVEARVIK